MHLEWEMDLFVSAPDSWRLISEDQMRAQNIKAFENNTNLLRCYPRENHCKEQNSCMS